MNQVVERMQSACLNESECNGDYPIKDCSNNFIIIREAEEERVFQNESCVYIQGEKEELIKLTDEFLYKIIGIK